MKKFLFLTIAIGMFGCGAPATPASSTSNDATNPSEDAAMTDTTPVDTPATAPVEEVAEDVEKDAENATPAPADDKVYVHCDGIDFMGSCEQREEGNVGTLAESCFNIGLEMADGPCPKENLFGTCEAEGISPMFLYKPMIDTEEKAKARCVQTTFVPAE